MVDSCVDSTLITGASSGLGAHFARCLAAKGWAVALAARRKSRLDALAAELEAEGAKVVAVEMDVASEASVDAAVAAAERAFGGLTGLVNNAGVASDGPALQMAEADWRATMSVNLDGVFRVAQRVGQGMAASGRGGAIVNIASILGLRVMPGLAAYCASKAAVVQLTQALALEWARHSVRVNALAPGYFPTEMNAAYLESDAGEGLKKRIPMRRFGRFEDLDAPLELLLGPGGAYVTGVTLPVDGGHVINSL